MKTIKAILKVFFLSVLILVVGFFVLAVVLAAKDGQNKKAAVYTATPELLIIPATATPTREPSPTPYGNDIYITLTAFAVAPPPTPTARVVRNAAVPIYDGNNNLIGYFGGDPTATASSAIYWAYQPEPETRSGCVIKGNVSKWNNDKHIYHCPNWRDYDKTEVNLSEGDRWFCSEAEALAAGFSKPENVSAPCIIY